MITAAQCRAARAWLEITQVELAQMIGCDPSTIRRIELNDQTVPLIYGLAAQKALEERGMKFTSRGIEGPE